MSRKDHTAEAEALFRSFAARHGFTIGRIDEPNVELLMLVPRQRGLSFELTLGLQDADVLNLGFEGFWSNFPFEERRGFVEAVLDGIAFGKCRLATHRQFGRVVERLLERYSNGSWTTIYVARSLFQIPIIGTHVSYLDN